MIPEECDVVVAGAGPSGLLVGTELALAGVNTLILERRGEPQLPRAGTLAPRVLEILDSRGLADRVMARAHELHDEPRAYTGIWAGFHGVRFDQLDSPYPHVLVFAQMEVERILAERAAELGCPVVRNVTVTGLTQDDDHVTVEFTKPDGTPGTVRARYLVGADGARSAVRRAAGITSTGHDADRTAVNVDAVLDYPFPEPITVTNNINGWGLSYPLRKGVTRFGLIDAVDSHHLPDVPVTVEDGKKMLTRIYGTDFGITEATTSRFHNAMYMADTLRSGRVLLVGESVRVHYPASGVGMNFCLQDAFNLGWKLAATVQGWAPDGLLDSYETERRPQIERLLADVRRQCAVQFTFTEEMLDLKRMIEHELIPMPEVNSLLAGNLSGIDARYPAAAEAPDLVGRRLRDTPVHTAEGTAGSVHQMLREQKFLLLGTDPHDPWQVPGPLAAHLRCAVLDDPRAAEGASGLLVRPDGHVAAAFSVTPGEAELAQWIAA
jgi:2-polyprenyl-6-methoxyphenol hydroxylase-like FAD-dependent oxidoreductase